MIGILHFRKLRQSHQQMTGTIDHPMNIRSHETRVALRRGGGVGDRFLTLLAGVVNDQAKRRKQRNRDHFKQSHTQAKIQSESHVLLKSGWSVALWVGK